MSEGTTPRPAALRGPPAWRMAQLAISIILSLMGVSWLIVGVALAPILTGGWMSVGMLALVMSVIPLAVFLLQRLTGATPGRWMRRLVFQPFWYAQFLLLGSALAALLGVLSGLPFGVGALFGRFFIGVAGAAFVVVALAGYVGARRLMRRDLEVTHPDLPAAFDGIRIVQATDLHLGPHSRDAFVERIADTIREAAGDLIAITGDLIDDFPSDVDRYARLHATFSPPLGVFVVPGNHDIYADWNRTRDRLLALPLTLLVNDARTIERDGARLTILGTGDPAGGRSGDSTRAAPNVPLAISHVRPGAFVVALAHNPGLWPALAQRGVPLTLSGHTHWGQLAVPSRNWCFASVFLDLAMGIHRRGASLLWISPATGWWGIPFRVGAPSEVTVLTLRRGATPAVTQRSYVRKA